MNNETIKKCYFCGKAVKHIYEYSYVDIDEKNKKVICNNCSKAYNAGYLEGKKYFKEQKEFQSKITDRIVSLGAREIDI